MKKFNEKIERKVKETVEYQVHNCINCNNSSITDKNDVSFNEKHKPVELVNILTHGKYGGLMRKYGGICHKCGSSYIEESMENENKGKFKYESASLWNKHNDIDVLITEQEMVIKAANDEIVRLKQLKNLRSKVTTLN
jgi:uncharacterized protein YdcH (DUF465 family)